MSNTLKFTLVGEDKSLSSTFNNAGKNAGGLGRTLSAAGAVGKVGLGVLAAGGAAAAAGIAASIKQAIPFDKTIRQVGAVAGVSGKGLADLSALAIKMGQDTVFSAGDAANAMLELAKGGFNQAQIKAGALAGTLTLATAGGLDLGDAAVYLSNTLNTFGLTAKDSNRVVAALAGGANASSASVESLGLALSQVGPGAKLAGASLESTVGVLAAFDNAGIKGSDAGTSLKTMFQRLVPSTKQAKDEMADLGLKFTDAKGNILPLRDVAEQLRKKLAGLSTAQKQTALTTIFGSDAYRAAAVLMDNGSAGVDKYTKATSDLTAAQALSKVGVEGAAGAWEQFTGSLDTLAVQAGTVLLPAFTSTVNYITKNVLPLAGNLISSFAGLAGKIAPPVSAAFSTVSGLVKNAGQTWGPSISAGVKSAWSGTSAVISDAVSKWGPVVKSGVSLAWGAISKVVSDAVAKWGPAIKDGLGKIDLSGIATNFSTQAAGWAQSIINGVKTGLETGNWSDLGKALGTGIVSAVEAVGSIIGKLTKAFGKFFAKVDWVGVGITLGKQVPSLLIGLVAGIVNFDLMGLLKGVAAHWFEILIAVLSLAFLPAKMVAGITRILTKIPFVGPLLAWAFTHLVGFSKGIVKYIGKALGGVGRAFLLGFRKVFPGIGEGFAKSLALLPLRLQVLAIDLAEKGLKMMLGLAEAVGKGLLWVVSKFGELTGYILKPFVKLELWLLRKGIDLVLGLLKGIGGVAKTIGKFIFDYVIEPTVRPFINAGLWLVRKGADAISGLKNGAISVAKTIGTWFYNNVILPTVRPFVNAGKWLVSKGADAISGLKNGAISVAKTIGTWFYNNVVAPTVRTFVNAGTWLYSKGSAAVSGLKNGAISVAKTIGTWFYNNVVVATIRPFVNAGTWLYTHGGHLIGGLKDGIVGAIKGIGGWVKGNIVDPIVDAVKNFFGIKSPSTVFAGIGGNLIAGLMKGLSRTNGTQIAKTIFGDMPHALGHIVKKGLVSVSSLPGKALGALSGLGGEFSGLFGGDPLAGAGVQRWRNVAIQALKVAGAPVSWIDSLMNRMQRESGGNPNAINLWDSNAKAGHPSQGLMQTIPGTFNAYAGQFASRGITDPFANIYAAIRYTIARYGSGPAGWDKPGGYRHGGWLMPGQLAWNETRKPEAVFNQDQLRNMANGGIDYDELAAAVTRALGPARQKPVDVHQHFPSNADPKAVGAAAADRLAVLLGA